VLTHGPYGTFLVHHPDVVGDAIIRGEFWDAYLEAAIKRHADPQRVAIDAGAYVGFHTVFLARHFRQVHAFEPEPHAYALLRTNIALNACRNAVAHERALYSHPCRVELAPAAVQEVPLQRDEHGLVYETIGNPAALAFVEAAGTRTDAAADDTVPAVTIDGLGLDRVGFIKVDTQGADLPVLRGAEQTIRRCRPVIAFEFERELSRLHGAEWPMFEAFFGALGYRLEEARRTPDGKQTDYLALPA
jgi:FkbM family methyltransferase